MKSFFFSAFFVAASLSTAFAQGQAPVATDSWGDAPAAAAPIATEDAAPEAAPAYTMSWNTAPGQSLSLHGRPTTDYWGRPLKNKRKANRTTASANDMAYQEEEITDPMMRSSGVMIAPGMNTAPYRGVSTDYWGRPLKKKSKGGSTLGQNAPAPASVASNTANNW